MVADKGIEPFICRRVKAMFTPVNKSAIKRAIILSSIKPGDRCNGYQSTNPQDSRANISWDHIYL